MERGDELHIFRVDKIDQLIGDRWAGIGAPNGVECAAAVAGLFEELSFCSFERGFAGVDPSAGAAEEPLARGVAVFFIDDELALLVVLRGRLRQGL